ncbi:MAG: HAD family hydrolase [Proteobacteria bacterium]|nr:HAD family hydrolase [Pseudomonadota bacterium]
MDAQNKSDFDLSSIKNWIFDLDGTLTNPIHNFDAIRANLGIPVGVDILNYLAGKSMEDQQKLHQRLNDIELDLAKCATPSSGAVELIERLVDKNCQIGILTRNTRKHAFISLREIRLDSYFNDSDVLGRHEAIPKPEPDGILKLLKNWEASPANSVMVGDYLHDLRAGVAAGTGTVHLDRTGQFAWSELATIEVKTLFDLAKLI